MMESTSTPVRTKPRAAFVLLGTACAALALIVVLLVQQNAALRGQLQSALQRRGAETFPLGETLASLPSFVAEKREPADPLAFADGRRATLVFVFSGSCDVCESTVPLVERLSAAAGSAATWVVGVQTDAKKPEDLRYGDRCFCVCGVPDIRETWIRRIDMVPALLLVDETGTLRGSWWGVPGPDDEAHAREAIERVSAKSATSPR